MSLPTTGTEPPERKIMMNHVVPLVNGCAIDLLMEKILMKEWNFPPPRVLLRYPEGRWIT
jgi:hypothetical protein